MTERFTLLSELGRGGMGVVWKARDEETGRTVALKLLRKEYAEDPEYLARFERELELAKRIHSAHVVEVFGYGVRDGSPYLALEFVDGPSLHASLAAHGPYSWLEANAILVQLTQGLADAHAAGVIHRDIKPANVLTEPSGTAKITDFGIAKGIGLTRLTATSTMLGTPTYLAPEGPIDERSDLYSLGILAYELLTGAAPFTGSTYQEVILRHVREAPDLSKLPPDSRNIVASLLAKEPAQRPQRASALLPALYGAMFAPGAPVPVVGNSAAPAAPSMRGLASPAAIPKPQQKLSPSMPSAQAWPAASYRPAPPPAVPLGWGQPAQRGFSIATGRMAIVRDEQAASILPDGSVLIVGGSDGGYLGTAELFDPRVGAFKRAGRMADPRVDHTATPLYDGFVLVAGGYCGAGPIATAELYDPSTRQFSRAESMTSVRAGHSATLLMDGSVLVAGGRDESTAFRSAEVYDPRSNRFIPVGAMTDPRAHHTATLLADGRVLIAGGCNGPAALASAEIFDPSRRRFSSVGSMIEARDCHTATPLPDGRILMVGGQDGIDEVPIGSTELFDPETTAFRPSGRLKTDRVHHSATALPDGRVLIAGGRDSTTCLSMVEIYDPGSGFLRVAAYMMSPRQEHTATLLFDGRVLLVGGLGGTPSPADAEVCVP